MYFHLPEMLYRLNHNLFSYDIVPPGDSETFFTLWGNSTDAVEPGKKTNPRDDQGFSFT